jgi:hypothetical protein
MDDEHVLALVEAIHGAHLDAVHGFAANAAIVDDVGQLCVLPGQFPAPLQLHCSLDRLDALASRSNGLTQRSLEALIGFDQPRVLIRRGNRRL